MTRNHSTVAYVEPNFVFSGLTAVAGDGETHDRAPDLEDYCINLDIIAEISSRHKNLKGMPSENKVICMSYEESNGKKSTVRFMSGTKVGGYHKDDKGEYKPNFDNPNVFTTYYADMHITDIVDYGTTEMVGIKSVDIDYNSSFVPVITVKFTDVRGMSIFQPNELNDDISYNGIRGFSKDNIAQSFFYAFFAYPIPKFTIILKGFYGDPVSYQVICTKFDSAFDSKSGCFDVTANFIGYAYSFMTDVSFNALLAAPYSDFEGSDYWDTQVKNRRFVLPDKNGNLVDMPKLYEAKIFIDTLLLESEDLDNFNSFEGENKYHEIEIQKLVDIRNAYWKWYDTLYKCLSQTFPGLCYRIGGSDSDDDYEMVFVLTNGENITSMDLSSVYQKLPEDFKKKTSQLNAMIDAYNNTSGLSIKLEKVKDKFDYPRVKVFKEIWINNRTKQYAFDGFHTSNILPKTETINAVFGDNAYNQQSTLKKLYNNGANQYIDAFVVDLNYTNVKVKINSLVADAKSNSDEKKKRNENISEILYNKMGWYPSIENFTKIVMAHLETLMAMMYRVIDDTKERTLDELKLSTGEFGLVDINTHDSIVPPFPRVTQQVVDSDMFVKSEDVWVGNINGGVGFEEIDMVNGLFNGVAQLTTTQRIADAVLINLRKEKNGNAKYVVSYPLTSYDFTMKKNPYGTFEGDDGRFGDEMAGKICMRMFGILALNNFVNDVKLNDRAAKLGEIEANNFFKLVDINSGIKAASLVKEGGVLNSADNIISVITSSDNKMPWGETPLFTVMKVGNTSVLSLTRYATVDEGEVVQGVYPIQDFSFSNLDTLYGAICHDKLPIENNTFAIYSKTLAYYFSGLRPGTEVSVLKSNVDTNGINTIEITDDYQAIWSNATIASNAEFYGDAMNDILGIVTPQDVNMHCYISTGGDFNNILDQSELKERKDGEPIPQGEALEYVFDGSNYSSEAIKGQITSYTLTECFGYSYDAEHKEYKTDMNVSLFVMLSTIYDLSGKELGNHNDFFNDGKKLCAFFLMSIGCLNYVNVRKGLEKSFAYVPKLVALQIGAAIYYAKYGGVTIDSFNTKIPTPDGLVASLGETICSLSPLAQAKFARYFCEWADTMHTTIQKLFLKQTLNTSNIIHESDLDGAFSFIELVTSEKIYERISDNKRAFLNQSSETVRKLTNDLMSMVCIIKLTVANAYSTSNEGAKYSVPIGVASTFLDSFLTTLKALNGLPVETDESGNRTAIASDASHVNDDMKIELYRYLKQLYDKWVSTASLDTWRFDSFFGKPSSDSGSDFAHTFFFIDSFYNKIGNKLLINPNKLSEIIKLSVTSMDINITMHSFLQEVYAQHKCMLKCVQNFKLLSNGISDLFIPKPYTGINSDTVSSDFVVIYTYEASKNLNVNDAEFRDDSFMLNDEFDTPVPIKSRWDENKYYKIPAFGVSYGRQYQHYFKSVNVNMTSPIMTEQAIIAKMTVLARSKGEAPYKSTTSQDIYDIYSNQSYTCVVEMMGCAYVQPLMYFVLLNVPFFKGSYLISKVKHRMVPGDMTTEITGVRMSKYCNRMVTDIFTDDNLEPYNPKEFTTNRKNKIVGVENDCSYKVFMIEDDGSGLTEQEKNNANRIKTLLIGGGYNNLNAVAGIIGNMRQETGPSLDPKSINENDKGYVAAGLCGWNERYHNLRCMLDNTPEKYGKIPEDDPNYRRYTAKEVRELFKGVGGTIPHQVAFLINTISSNTKQSLISAYTPEAAAKVFRDDYEIGTNTSDRQKYARQFYNYFINNEENAQSKEDTNGQKYAKLFMGAIQNSIDSTDRYKGELNVSYGPKDGVVTINPDSSEFEDNRLVVVFDIILNTPEYFRHVSQLTSYFKKGGATELPTKLVVIPTKETRLCTVRILEEDETYETVEIPKFRTSEDCNDKLIRSVSKKYFSGVRTFNITVPQFGEFTEWDKYKPISCDDVYKDGSCEVASEAVTSDSKIKIGNWDVEESVKWINANARECYDCNCVEGSPRNSNGGCKKLCATYVELAIANGGGPSMHCGGNGHATNLRYNGILEKNHFRCIKSGILQASQRNVEMELQAGDVAIIGKYKGEKYHACMWTGNRWVSDYKQNNLNAYGTSEPYAIYRYLNRKGVKKT